MHSKSEILNNVEAHMLKTSFQITFVSATLALVAYALYESFTWQIAGALVGIFILISAVLLVWGYLSPAQQRYMNGNGGIWLFAFVVIAAIVTGLIRGLS